MFQDRLKETSQRLTDEGIRKLPANPSPALNREVAMLHFATGVDRQICSRLLALEKAVADLRAVLDGLETTLQALSHKPD